MNPFDDQYISAEIQRRAELSRRQVADMVDREIRCPHCNYVMAHAYDNLHSGHITLIERKENTRITRYASIPKMNCI